MRKPIVLTGPGLSSEDVARIFKISPARQAALQKIVDSVLGKGSGRNGTAHKRSTRKPSEKKVAGRKQPV